MKNIKESKALLPCHNQPGTSSLKVKATIEMIRATVESMGIGFTEFDKCEAH